MSSAPGTRLGPYEIVAPIGAGGMGEVYRARDTKLNRDVALKILPELFTSDADRLARFRREAQVLASLNHPNIAAIYGFEDSGATHALVMELVEGRDLSEMIAAGSEDAAQTRGIPIADALRIARQIADALEAAHEQGIVHRDLKPANVKVKADGTVKVLDFGLAKAVQGDVAGSRAQGRTPSESPTLTARATQMGMIIGTAAYMSPEQARGKAVDKRADIWAFGVVLYEMVTGRRAFEGSEITDVLAAVLRQDIDWRALPPDTPPRLRRLLERALDRDVKTRLRDIGEARVAIATIEAGEPEPQGGVAAAAAPSRPSRRVAPLLIATAVVAIGVTYALTRWRTSAGTSHASGAVAQVSIDLPDGDEVGELSLSPVAISRDDSRVAYIGLRDGKTQIFVRALGDRSAKALEGTDGAEAPFFSPDGQWIGFFAGSKLKKIAVGGTAVQPMADAPFERGGDWGDDGYIYFAPTNISGIWRVPEGGGAATEVTHKDAALGEISHRWPHVIAGSGTLLFSDWIGPGKDEQNIAIQSNGATTHHLLVKGGNAPRYVPTLGLLFYAHIGEIVAVPWRPAQADLGRAVPVALPQRVNDGGGNEGAGNDAISGTGTLVYLAGGRSRNARRLAWIDRAGKVEPAQLPERDYENVLFAPDGNRAVVQIRDSVTELWIYDVGRNTLTPISNSTGSSQAPVWSADGTRLVYRGTRAGFRNLYWRMADGSGSEERLTTKPDVSETPTSVSPDGHWLLFNEGGAQEVAGSGIWLMALDGDRTPRHFFQTPAGETDGQISPDGKWVAYQTPVSSRQEVYVSHFPGPGPRRQVSTDGGTEPLWSRDGHELFFQNGAKLMGVTVTIGSAFSASAPRVVHEGRFLKTINGNTDWTITRDGTRFLRIQQVEPERPVTRIDLVFNWLDEVKRLVSSGSK